MEKRVPFQVMLDPEQHHQLGRVAARRGQSVGSLVRESVARYLADLPIDDDPLMGLIGLAADDGPRPYGDVATEHDRYLADAVAEESNRPASAPDAPAASKPRQRRRTTVASAS